MSIVSNWQQTCFQTETSYKFLNFVLHIVVSPYKFLNHINDINDLRVQIFEQSHILWSVPIMHWQPAIDSIGMTGKTNPCSGWQFALV